MRFQQHFRFLFRRSLTIKFVRQTHEKLIPIIEIQRIERQLNDRDTEREYHCRAHAAANDESETDRRDLLVMIICGYQICTSDQLFRLFSASSDTSGMDACTHRKRARAIGRSENTEPTNSNNNNSLKWFEIQM